MKHGHRYYSSEYQRVIIVAKHGKYTDGSAWLLDTSGILYQAESFVPYHQGEFNT